MSDKITLFQNDRAWAQIKTHVFDSIEQDHGRGLAQNGALAVELEKRLSERFDRKHCVTTGSCSDALTIAVLSLRLPQGSRIAVSNYTFTATAHAIARAGHLAVPIDVDENYCIDVDKIHDCAAVVAVDIFGNMSSWDKLDKLKIPVICDAAQSLESRQGAWSAKQGLISCVSFSPSKTVSSWGSGGALLTDNDDIAQLAKKLRLHGKTNNNQTSVHPGMNSMISSFESACVLVGLEYADKWQQRRKKIAEYLAGLSKHQCAVDFTLEQHTFHKLVFQSDDRQNIMNRFKKANIDCVVHYQLMINDEQLYATGQGLAMSDKLKNISFTVPNQHTLTDIEVERIGELLK